MHMIDIVGLGLTEDTLTRGAMRMLQGGGKIMLHTGRIGAADWLAQNGIAFDTLDDLYENTDDFDEHAEAACEAILDMAAEQDVVYGVIDVRDESVRLLLQEAAEQVSVHAGVPVDGALEGFVTGGTYHVSASDYENYLLRADQATLVREIDTMQLAGEVKLRLTEVYPDEAPAYVLCGGRIEQIELCDLDRMEGYDHRFCVLVPAVEDITAQYRFSFDDMMRIIRKLQGRGGCPWDREQTHESFRPYLIDEAYEVADAVDSGDPFELADELGDALFIIASHAEIGRRTGEFDITDVTTAICEKMIHRHPKVFGRGGADAEDEWNKRKMEEKQLENYTQLLKDITRALPATARAVKVQHRLQQFGLPATDEAAWAEQAGNAIAQLKDPSISAEQALGCALTALCGIAEARGVDVEMALNGASDRIIRRFAAAEQGVAWDSLTLEEKLQRWNLAEK